MSTLRNIVQNRVVGGFSLLELLAAMAVLSLMMVFLFNLVAQTIRTWESGSRQIEAAQAARIGLERMADDLQFSLGGSGTAPKFTVTTPTRTSIVPFYSTNNATSTLGFPAAFSASPNSGQIFCVSPYQQDNNNLYEIGFLSLYTRDQNGYDHIPGLRYNLMRHTVPSVGGSITGNFFFADFIPPNQTGPAGWISEGPSAISAGTPFRTPIIPNCYQINFLYFTNDANGALSPTDSWPSEDRIPNGILVTAKVMDEKTANRISRLQPSGLTANDLLPNSSTVVGRLVREGTVEVRRFIPFVNSEP